MEKNQLYNSISEYDKHNNLIRYLELTDDNEHVKCFYNVNGNRVEKSFLQCYKSKDSTHTETLRSIVEYDDNVKLFSLTLDGETYIKPIVSGSTSFVTPNIVNSMFSSKPEDQNLSSVETFTLNSNLIDDYLNKL